MPLARLRLSWAHSPNPLTERDVSACEMTVSLETVLLAAAVLLVLSAAASKLSDLFGIPALLIFLVIGMLAVKAIFEIKLPRDYLVVLIARGDEFLIPNGSVVLQENERMLGLAQADTHRKVQELIVRGQY